MRKLRKSEINRIIKENSALSNEELVDKYFDIVFSDCLGSQAERMKEMGWEESDIKERREHEEYMDQYADVLCWILNKREIDPWRDYYNDSSKTCMNGGTNIVDIEGDINHGKDYRGGEKL